MVLNLKLCLFMVCFVLLHVVVVSNDNVGKQRPKRNSNSKTTNNEEFEKFFLKASKSVPRIGRRGSSNDNSFNWQKYAFFRYPFIHQPKRSIGKDFEAALWSNIDTLYEYNPDLPNILEYLSSIQRDSPPGYENLKLKNIPNDKNHSQTQEGFCRIFNTFYTPTT
ncbi:hypothetical protein RN001_000895 [Aquatica leii]|uniref:Uncharacterized protein n=1 Tax=Aquatica leii TaxID=1421715 RepID=A0AAN7SKV9_9COLE|nr:hypothetical protein RN001_000895 [Aquatica leii]